MDEEWNLNYAVSFSFRFFAIELTVYTSDGFTQPLR